jgi:polyketide biosynthesis enoyl-CoA hydratase PksH
MSGAFETLRLTPRAPVLEVMLNRPERGNALTARMIAELHRALDAAEADPAIRLLVLSGAAETFCAGMDFAEATGGAGDPAALEPTVRSFYQLMERFTLSPVVIAALVTGRVTAGGVGLVAASDYAIAGPAASFQLSEAIFGLLPATVAPFIVRRCGLHPTYRLTLTARRIDAAEAVALGLIDETGADPADLLRQFLVRVARVREECVGEMKRYFHRLWIIGRETEEAAVGTITGLIGRPGTMEAIARFVQGADPAWRR